MFNACVVAALWVVVVAWVQQSFQDAMALQVLPHRRSTGQYPRVCGAGTQFRVLLRTLPGSVRGACTVNVHSETCINCEVYFFGLEICRILLTALRCILGTLPREEAQIPVGQPSTASMAHKSPNPQAAIVQFYTQLTANVCKARTALGATGQPDTLWQGGTPCTRGWP